MQHIGQHEAAFGVGIDDFDRLARHRLDNVAWALRFAVRHVLNQPDRANHIDFGFARGKGVHEADDASSAGHVAFHVFHSRCRLD